MVFAAVHNESIKHTVSALHIAITNVMHPIRRHNKFTACGCDWHWTPYIMILFRCGSTTRGFDNATT